MLTSDKIGRTTTNKTSNTEHQLHRDHQIFKYFTSRDHQQTAEGTTTETTANGRRNKANGRRNKESAVKHSLKTLI